MRWSSTYIPTLRDSPQEAEVVSHRLLLRAGMVRKLASGIYSLLPLGLAVMRKFEGIVREEMNRAGALECALPMVQPAELWWETGRWDQMGPELLRLKDRGERPFCLGPTHEEVIVDLVRRDVKSYKQLPMTLYQIQTKFRDEIRPRFGLMRAREFTMKDAYSFDLNDAGAEKSYEAMRAAYRRIFERAGLRFKPVEADTGAIGGSASEEFIVLAETGESELLSCAACEYAANVEKAESRAEPPTQKGESKIEEIATPGQATILDVCRFLNESPVDSVKSLLYVATRVGEREHERVLIFIRGDHEVNEFKLSAVLSGLGAPLTSLRLATDAELSELNLVKGFIGPVHLPEAVLRSVRILADEELSKAKWSVAGANRKGFHLLGLFPERDFPKKTAWVKIRMAREGEPCARCGGSLFRSRGIEVGHVFRLGTKYSAAMKAEYTNEAGELQPMVMGCYGIGIGRTVAAAIEQNHDERGIIWPVGLAPFDLSVIAINCDIPAVRNTVNDLETVLTNAHLNPLIDDRALSAGAKFKDHELIGIPLNVIVGEKGLKSGTLELRERRTMRTVAVSLSEFLSDPKRLIADLLSVA